LLTPNAGVAGSVSLQSFGGDITKVPVTVEIRRADSAIVYANGWKTVRVDRILGPTAARASTASWTIPISPARWSMPGAVHLAKKARPPED
jgi:hypothetical protein